MSLSVKGQIIASDILIVKKKAENVFCLHGKNGGSLIVKAEKSLNVRPGQAKFGAKFMNAVDPFATAKVLMASEISALKSWSSVYEGPSDPFRKMLNDNWPVWLKMETRDSLVSLEQAVKERDEDNDKTKIRQIAAALNAPKGLERLGEIAATDLFNGTSDRFVPYNKDSELAPWHRKNSTIEYGVKTLNNVDNVLLALEGRNLRPIGLDAFDPSSAYRDQVQPLKDIESNEPAKWPGRMLAANKVAERMAFARDIVEDLETLLGPRNRKLPFTNTHRLDSDAARRIYKGMDSGTTKIKEQLRKYLQSNKRQNDLVPRGVIDRACALGWVYRSYTMLGKDLGFFWRG